MMYRVLAPGDPAPWVQLPTPTYPAVRLDKAAGRYVVLCFLASTHDTGARAALREVAARRALFDDDRASFFAISNDRADQQAGIKDRIPGIRFFWDFDGEAARLYGAQSPEAKPQNGRIEVRQIWYVLDPMLRILKVVPFGDEPAASAKETLDYVAALPPPGQHAGLDIPPPVIVLPSVFEPTFSERLIQIYEAQGGKLSGFMNEVGGKTVVHENAEVKVRRDVSLEDKALLVEIQRRVQRRIVPEIKKVHQFDVTRMERYLVACYSAEDGGHFKTHRDNTTKGTAHRRFAVSINLNADFDGGEIAFPEYGPRTFKPPIGGAVVFSCSLLHAVTKMTRGRRYAFLPFLYDEAAAAIRAENNPHLGEGVGKYDAATGLQEPSATP